MARPRTPTNVLEMRGAFAKNPQRARPDEPEALGVIGPAPDHFELDQVAAWNEITSSCHAGVLCRADRLAVEQAACLLEMSRRRPIKLDSGDMQYPEMKSSDRTMLIGLLARFGMTPSDRSKVTAPKKETANAFAKHIKGKTA